MKLLFDVLSKCFSLSLFLSVSLSLSHIYFLLLSVLSHMVSFLQCPDVEVFYDVEETEESVERERADVLRVVRRLPETETVCSPPFLSFQLRFPSHFFPSPFFSHPFFVIDVIFLPLSFFSSVI